MCVFLLSITADSARLFLSFRRPNRGDIVSFEFVQSVPPPSTTTGSVCLHSFRLPNRGCSVIVVAFVSYRYPPRNWRHGDIALSGIIVLYFGFYSELYFWVLFRPPTTGSTGPRLHRADELGLYRVFRSSNCVLFHYYRRVAVTFPRLQGHRTTSLPSPRLLSPLLCPFRSELITYTIIVCAFLFRHCISNK